jgi:hypothetical protein
MAQLSIYHRRCCCYCCYGLIKLYGLKHSEWVGKMVVARDSRVYVAMGIHIRGYVRATEQGDGLYSVVLREPARPSHLVL